jgi:hypothetical protein
VPASRQTLACQNLLLLPTKMALGVLLALQASSVAALLGPDPLAGTPYSTEHDSACVPPSSWLLCAD